MFCAYSVFSGTQRPILPNTSEMSKMDFSSHASEQESVSLIGAALKTMLTICSDVLGELWPSRKF